MRALADFLNRVDWYELGVKLGLGLFVLISLVRCALS